MLHLVDDKHSREEFPLFGKTYQTYEFDLSIKEVRNMKPLDPVSNSESPGMGPTAGRSANYPKK